MRTMSFLDRVKPADADDRIDPVADDRFGARLEALSAQCQQPVAPRPSPFSSVRTRSRPREA
jgi:hypothetical protein